MLNTDKNLKLYYSISEVARMFDVNESLLRFWEKEFPQLRPKKGGRGIRQYRKEDIETVKLIYHLVKERGMTLPGARQRMKDNKEATLRNFEIVERLKSIPYCRYLSDKSSRGMTAPCGCPIRWR